MPIIVSKQGRDARKIDSSSFEQEDYLQKYIYENPDSIPLYEIKEDVKLLILVREFSTNSGPIDALGIDRDGQLYVIETKLYKNPDKRLVVAQVLDYGASLWRYYSDFNDFTRLVEAEINRRFKTTLNQKLIDFFGLNSDEVSTLLENVRDNLNEGSFKFVVLMDKLHSQLKDLVTFINQNSQFTIYAVEMEYYKYEDYEILIPRLYGAEARKEVGTVVGQRRKWDEKTFFEDTKAKIRDEAKLEAIRRLYTFSKGLADEITWGTGIASGSFNPKFSKISGRSLYSVYSDGRLVLSFGWLDDTETAKKFKEDYRNAMQEIEEFRGQLDTDSPQFALETWSPVAEKFSERIGNLIAQHGYVHH